MDLKREEVNRIWPGSVLAIDCNVQTEWIVRESKADNLSIVCTECGVRLTDYYKNIYDCIDELDYFGHNKSDCKEVKNGKHK